MVEFVSDVAALTMLFQCCTFRSADAIWSCLACDGDGDGEWIVYYGQLRQAVGAFLGDVNGQAASLVCTQACVHTQRERPPSH